MVNHRKEIAVLLVLGILVAVFAFTLGVHLGKRVSPQGIFEEQGDPATVISTVDDQVPERRELLEQEKNVPEAVEEALDETLRQEVQGADLKLDSPVQTELPEEPKTKNAGATQVVANEPQAEGELQDAISSLAAATRPSPEGRFTLQVGSHRTVQEAAEQVSFLEQKGQNPFLRSVLLNNKGRWYRVYVGGYASKSRAEEAGLQLKSKGTIESYLITNMVP